MGIINIVPDFAGQIGDVPRRVKIITTDSLATIRAAGYLNSQSLLGNVIYPTDFIDVVYNFSRLTKTGINVTMVPAIASGIITLNVSNVIANTTAVYGGGATSNTFTANGLVSGMIVTAILLTSTNNVTINKAVPGTNTLAVTFSGDPGANTTVNYIAIPATL